MIKEIRNIDEIIDWTWDVYNQEGKSSYHKIMSRDDLINTLKRGVESSIRSIIACYKDGKLNALSLYHYIEDKKYLQTEIFVIDEKYNSTADEIIEYLREKFKGYEVLIGVPFDNVRATEYFNDRGIKCIEASYDMRLKKEEFIEKKYNEKIIRIDEKNFSEFAEFYDGFAIPEEMFWNSEAIKKDMTNSEMYACIHDERIIGCTYSKGYEGSAEIFAMFIDEKFRNSSVEGAILDYTVKNLFKRYIDAEIIVYFIYDDSEYEYKTSLGAGFKIFDTYKCFKIKL